MKPTPSFTAGGEGSTEWLPPVIETTLRGWEELLVGRNLLDVVAICDDIADRLPWKGGPVLGSALAAINMALYDIAGKAWKAPVYQLLGGKKRDRIKIYNGGINFESVERARAEARAAVEAGARGLNRNFHFELHLHPKTYASYPVVSIANRPGLFEVAVRHILAVLRSRCAGFACPACLAADTCPARPLLST